MISKRLKEILPSKGLTLSDFIGMCEEQEGLAGDTVKNIYYGRTPDPKVSTVMKLSRVLGMSVNCLMGQCSHSKEERAVLNYYRECGEHGKSVIEYVAKYEAASAKSEREAFGRHKILCLTPSGDIHNGIIYEFCERKEIYTTDKRAYAAIKMPNNDLCPTFCKGDIVLIENRFPCNGEYGYFVKGNKTYLRQYIEEDGKYILRYLRLYDEDMVFKRMDEIECVGTCANVIRA